MDTQTNADITSGTTPASFSTLALAAGLVGTPSLYFSADATTGWYRRAANAWTYTNQGVGTFEFASGSILRAISTASFGWGSGDITTSIDTSIIRASANSIRFTGSSPTSTVTSRTETNVAIASIADAAATACLTITVPNAAHSASIQIRVTGSLGAGGAIGANEATATNTYLIALTRTAGVNATAAISAAFGAAATAVAGAATVTCTAAMSAVSGAVGATNTFTVSVTITRSGGSSTNHTCLVYAVLMNANASGITIA